MRTNPNRNPRWRPLCVVASLAAAMALVAVAPASAITVGSDIDLRIAKQADVATALPGDTVTWTVTVTNDSTAAALNVMVTDDLPAGFTFVSATANCTAAGSQVTCDLGAINGVTGVNVATFDIVTTANHTAVGDCVNTASVTGVAPSGNPDVNLSNNTASATVACDVTPLPPPTQIDLELTKSVDQTVVPVGASVIWTITVTNKGPAAATGVTVSDKLPATVSYVSDNGGGAFNSATGSWTIGSLAAGASASLQITTTVGSPGTHVNGAQVATADQTDIDSTPGNSVAAEDDQDLAEVGTVTVLQAAVTTAPATVVADTLVNTGPPPQTRNLALVGLAALLVGGAFVLVANDRRRALRTGN